MCLINSVKGMQIHMMECLYLPDDLVIVERLDVTVDIDPLLLRQTVMKRACNSYTKCMVVCLC